MTRTALVWGLHVICWYVYLSTFPCPILLPSRCVCQTLCIKWMRDHSSFYYLLGLRGWSTVEVSCPHFVVWRHCVVRCKTVNSCTLKWLSLLTQSRTHPQKRPHTHTDTHTHRFSCLGHIWLFHSYMTKVGMFLGIIATATAPPLAPVSFLWGTVSTLFRFQGQSVQIGMLVSKLGGVQILLCCLSVE